LKTEQFAAEYELLKDIAEEHAKQTQSSQEKDNFWNFALAVFGIILGGVVVTAILNVIFGENDT
jgi:hypothetical protein